MTVLYLRYLYTLIIIILHNYNIKLITLLKMIGFTLSIILLLIIICSLYFSNDFLSYLYIEDIMKNTNYTKDPITINNLINNGNSGSINKENFYAEFYGIFDFGKYKGNISSYFIKNNFISYSDKTILISDINKTNIEDLTLTRYRYDNLVNDLLNILNDYCKDIK